jgi:two-component system sensor histidine kinase HydH
MAFLIARNLQLGVSMVEKRLRNLERDLSAPATGVSGICEIEQINAGLSRMAATLHQKIGQEQEMQEQLRHSERLAALGKVAAGVAHELRNPLSTIRLRAQMNLRGTDPETIRKSSSITIEEINRLDHMVERLLYFARPMRLDLERVDVLAVAKSSAERARSAAQRAGVLISIQAGGNPLVADGDESALRQVFDNLVSNAVESLDAKRGSITITGSSESEGDAILVMVSDTGSGISPEDLTRIFDPFFTTKGHGTGLGLSISYEIVKAHQGDLRVTSKLGEGTTIIVSLPRANRVAVNDLPIATREVAP